MTLPIFPYPMPQPPGAVATLGGNLVFGDAISFEASATVYRKTRWAGAWIEDTTLDVLQVNWNAAPQIPVATLRYRYGRCVERGATSETTRTKKALGGHYVKIVVSCGDGNRVWHGFVDDAADEQTGTIRRVVPQPAPDPPIVVFEPTGVQTFSCVGMLAALDRAPIDRTIIQTASGFQDDPLLLGRVTHSPPMFNLAPNEKDPPADRSKNRAVIVSTVKTRSGSEFFVPDLGNGANLRQTYRHRFDRAYGNNNATDATEWRLRDTLEYLVAWHGPQMGKTEQWRGPFNDRKAEFIPVWIFDHELLDPNDEPNEPTETQYAADIIPRIDCEGLTLKGALDRLLNTDTGHGYFAWVDESTTPNRVYIEPYSTLTDAASALTAGGASMDMPPAARKITVTTVTDSATALTVQESGANRYSIIEIIGAPKITVCTLEVSTHLTPAWDPALETALTTALTGLNANVLRDAQRMRDIREEGRFRPVGRHYRLVNAFPWQITHGGTTRDIFEIPAGLVFGARYLPNPLRTRILDWLPLRQGIDYAGADEDAIQNEHINSRAPQRNAEVYARSFATDATLTGKRTNWSTKAARPVLYDPNDPAYGIRIAELQNDLTLGIAIEIDGAPQEALAAGGGRVAPHIPKIDPAASSITVATQSDEPANRTVEAPGRLGTNASNIDAERKKVFDLGGRFQDIRVLGGTIVGVNENDDTYRRVPETIDIRNDFWLPAMVGTLATQYYFVPRRVLRLQSRRITAALWPGQMVTTLNPATLHETPLNTTISEVSITFGVGTGGAYVPATMNVQTAFGEIDPLAVFPTLEG